MFKACFDISKFCPIPPQRSYLDPCLEFNPCCQAGDGYMERLMWAMTEAVTQPCPVRCDTARLIWFYFILIKKYLIIQMMFQNQEN